MKINQTKSLLGNILVGIDIIVVFAVISNWANFKAGLAG